MNLREMAENFLATASVERLATLLIRVEQAALEMAASEAIDCSAIDADARRLMAFRIRELAKERASGSR